MKGLEISRAFFFEWDTREYAFDLIHIMSIYLPNCPAEGLPLPSQRFQIKYFLHCTKALNLVVVHNGNQIVQPVVWCEQRGFPYRTLITLTIAKQHENAIPCMAALARQGYPAADGESVPQRARGYLNARHATGNVTCQT